MKNTNNPVAERQTRNASMRCSMCGGNGWSMFESVCENCKGDGNADVLVYADCGCAVEVDGDPDCFVCYPEDIEIVSAAA